MADFSALNADVLICGGIGGGAQTALAAAGIKLFGGVSGDADKAVEAFINDTFSFFYCIFLINLMFVTSSKAAVAALTVTNSEISTLDSKWMNMRQFVFWTRKVIVRSSVQYLCRSQEQQFNEFTRLPGRK